MTNQIGGFSSSDSPVRRKRGVLDDRHIIRNPLGSVEDCQVFVNTMLKQRVSSLFLTEEGLFGHAVQLQHELNRLTKLDGVAPEVVVEAVSSAAIIRDAIKKARDSAKCPLKGEVRIVVPFTHETILL